MELIKILTLQDREGKGRKQKSGIVADKIGECPISFNSEKCTKMHFFKTMILRKIFFKTLQKPA